MVSIEVATRLQIRKPSSEVFEALVDPGKMANYWFSWGSGRLEPGKTITLRYEEYGAQVDITVVEVAANKKVVFRWPDQHLVTITLQALENGNTIIEVVETGWNEQDDALIQKLLGNKEGWVYVLTCLKAYLEFGVSQLRAALAK